jgi:hypothetical protein
MLFFTKLNFEHGAMMLSTSTEFSLKLNKNHEGKKVDGTLT